MRTLIVGAAFLSLAAAPTLVKIKDGAHVTMTTPEGMARSTPYFIEGAEAGDLIVVTIEKLEPVGTTATSPSSMAPAAFDAGELANKAAAPVPWTIDKARQVVSLDLRKVIPNVDWAARYAPPVYELPLQPAVGFVGTAPGDRFAMAIAGERVMLPVNEAGALLTFGYGLARHGDGDVTGTGIETALDVGFSVEVVKKKEWPHSSVARASTIAGEFPIEWPRIETSDYIKCVGTAATLHDALKHATTELHHWMDDDFGFSEKSLSIFLGPAIEYEVVNVAGPVYAVAAKVKKSLIPKIAQAQ
jgi:acetamidase/formamidase